MLLVSPGMFVVSPAGEIHTILLKHRTAQEIIPLIRPLLGPNDVVGGTGYRLLVHTSEANLRDIERTLSQLDVARRSFTLTAQLVPTADAGRILRELTEKNQASDEIRIKLSRNTVANEGPVAGGDAPTDSLRYRTKRRTETHSDNRTQTLRAQNGQRVFIRVGQSIPYLTVIKSFSGTAPSISQGVEFQNITTGFDIVPQLQGELVNLSISPRIVAFETLVSGPTNREIPVMTIAVKLGEWIDLGKIDGNDDEIHRAILESAESTAGERYTILLKVE